MEQLNHLWRLPLALAAIVALNACGEAPQAGAQMPVARVSVAAVIEQPLNAWDEFTGRLEAPESVEIRPRVSGFIDRVAFAEGSLVKQGDLLFQIDPRPFQAEVKRLQAQLQQARANQARTASEAKRGERLRKSNAISAELADARASAAQEAQAAVAGIQAELDNARLNLSFTRVTAPIDGRVSRAEITAGNLVTAGQSLLTRLVSTDKVYAYFDADERVFLKYLELARQSGSDARDASPVYLGLSSEDGHPHLGQLDFLDNQVNPQTGTIRGRAVFDNQDGRFTPGLYARLKLVGSGTYAATLIQDVAVGTDLGKKFVLVLGDDNTVLLDDGSSHILTTPSERGVQTSGFTVPAGGEVSFTIDFDVRKSLVNPVGQDSYRLKPVLRLVDNSEVGTIEGTVAGELITQECGDAMTPEFAGNVYVHEGADAVPDDIGSENEPLVVAPVDENGTYTYTAAFIPAGEYTVSYTCGDDLIENDQGEPSDDDINFNGAQNVTVVASETSTADFELQTQP